MREGEMENKELVYQQQVCTKCGSVVGMMRPIKEQFRTWCMACHCYRKIFPDDTTLTAEQWNLVCMSLDRIYREWVQRGSLPSECVDPQFDREIARCQA